MKMKKIMAVMAMAGILTASLTGCGNPETNAAAQDNTPAPIEENDQTDDAAEEPAQVEDESADTISGDITIVSREDGSGTRGAFIELFGVEEKIDDEKVDMTTEEANITNSTSVMMSTVAGDECAIGYISLGSLNDTVKALRIDGAEATAENIKAGTYQISRPFNIATKDDSNEAAQDFISFILSDAGQEVVDENGYISLDETEVFESAQPEGKVVIGGSSSVTPVMEKLKEAYEVVNPNATIEIQQSDSTTGMTSTAEGIFDIGMASRELKDSELEDGLQGIVIALDGIAVIVNQENPIDELSSEEVKGIYVGDTLTWDEVVY